MPIFLKSKNKKWYLIFLHRKRLKYRKNDLKNKISESKIEIVNIH